MQPFFFQYPALFVLSDLAKRKGQNGERTHRIGRIRLEQLSVEAQRNVRVRRLLQDAFETLHSWRPRESGG